VGSGALLRRWLRDRFTDVRDLVASGRLEELLELPLRVGQYRLDAGHGRAVGPSGTGKSHFGRALEGLGHHVKRTQEI